MRPVGRIVGRSLREALGRPFGPAGVKDGMCVEVIGWGDGVEGKNERKIRKRQGER